MTYRAARVVPVSMAPDAGAWVDPAIDLVAGEVFAPVGNHSAWLVTPSKVGPQVLGGGMALHAERFRVAGGAKVTGLGTVGAVIKEELVGMDESAVRFERAREFIIVTIQAVHLAAGQFLRVPGCRRCSSR